MNKTRVRIHPADPGTLPEGRGDHAVPDSARRRISLSTSDAPGPGHGSVRTPRPSTRGNDTTWSLSDLSGVWIDRLRTTHLPT